MSKIEEENKEEKKIQKGGKEPPFSKAKKAT